MDGIKVVEPPEEYRCVKCGIPLFEGEVIWALPDGTLNTNTGDAYCDYCLPPEGEK